MPFAVARSSGLSSLVGLVFLGWSVVATAQPATAPKAPKAPKPPAAAKAPAVTVKKTANPTTDVAPATDSPAAAVPIAPDKAPKAPADKTAAPATTPAATPAAENAASSVRSGEGWGSPGVEPASSASTARKPGDPGSPWPETNAEAADKDAPPPVYYVEPAPDGTASGARPPPVGVEEDVEPMKIPIDEPPPPPVPRHIAPRMSLWLGARLGYFVPFGDIWGRCSSSGYSACDRIEGTKFSDVASSGPMVELDVGMRLGRNYMLYLGWERAQLGAADGPSPDSSYGSRQSRADSDFVAVGFRLSANPDDLGLVLDLAIGARRFRGVYEGATELQLTDAPMESRLGIGADIRINRKFSLSPMLTLGLGSFGKADWVTRDTVESAMPLGSDRLTHGWLTLQIGGHFDIAGKS